MRFKIILLLHFKMSSGIGSSGHVAFLVAFQEIKFFTAQEVLIFVLAITTPFDSSFNLLVTHYSREALGYSNLLMAGVTVTCRREGWSWMKELCDTRKGWSWRR